MLFIHVGYCFSGQFLQDEVNPYELLELKLKYLSYTGLNPMKTSVTINICSGILISILYATLVCTVIYCFQMSSDMLGQFVINLVLVGAVWQMALKTSFFYFRTKTLSDLINKIYSEFWRPELLDLTERQSKSIALLYKVAATIDFIFTSGVIFSISGHCVMAIVQGNYNMPVNVWLPNQIRFLINSSPYYRFIQLFQILYMIISTLSCVLQGDLLFVIIITMILAQFKMLKYKLILVGDIETKEGRKRALAKIINHHNLLYHMTSEIEDVFSFLILQLLGTSMFLVVISYVTVFFIDEFSKKMLFFVVGSSSFLQFSLYCFLGQFLQDESLSVGEVVYNCNWENIYDKEMRQTLVIMLQRSQNQVNISMGKFMILNLENLTKVTKAMFSFFTFVLNMKE